MVPAPVPLPAPTPTPGAAAALAKLQKGRAAKGAHGVGDPRGSDIVLRSGRDREARFGTMFKRLQAFNPPDALLTALALKMNDGKAPLNDVKDSDVAFDNETMPAGYIYFGQFVDHDMTLDKTPLTQQKQDVRGMVNYDTPRFDLGSVYGKGPTGSPELYDPAKPGYLLVNPHDELFDLPRDGVGAAYLGDPRNDENLIVAQLHVVFLRMHNKLRDGGKTFEQAQQQLRWTYQYLIVNDFLAADRRPGRRHQPDPPPGHRADPVHGQALPAPQRQQALHAGGVLRRRVPLRPQHDPGRVRGAGRAHRADLRPGRLRGPARQPADPASLWIDWNYFFEIPGMNTPDDRNMARLIDTQLSLPLFKLPSTVVAPTAGAIVALAERNLLRGKRLGLPAGQDVATAMGIKPLTNAQLGLTEPGWKGKAPLWFYILKESELLGGKKIGPVGGRIVAEVILGLMALDKTSYFNANPSFVPGPNYKMGDFILAADAIDPRARILTPEEPEDPNAPEEPEAPEDPNAPEEPEAPEAPEVPEAPEAPGAGADTGPAKLPPDELVNPAATAPVESGSLTVPV